MACGLKGKFRISDAEPPPTGPEDDTEDRPIPDMPCAGDDTHKETIVGMEDLSGNATGGADSAEGGWGHLRSICDLQFAVRVHHRTPQIRKTLLDLLLYGTGTGTYTHGNCSSQSNNIRSTQGEGRNKKGVHGTEDACVKGKHGTRRRKHKAEKQNWYTPCLHGRRLGQNEVILLRPGTRGYCSVHQNTSSLEQEMAQLSFLFSFVSLKRVDVIEAQRKNRYLIHRLS